MENKCKRFLSLVMALVMIVGMLPVFASAATISGGTALYLSPNANWTSDNARFAAYFFGDGDAWVSMTDSNYDGVYECTSPAGKNFTNVIFCRMDPAKATNSWDNRWNQTSNLSYDGTKNLYTVADGVWSEGSGTWSVYTETDPVYVVAGEAELCGEAWATESAANTMTKNAEGLYEKVYENVAADTYEYKVVRNGNTWFDNSTGQNCSVTVTEPSNITIKFDPATQKITHETEPVVVDTATVSTLDELLTALGNEDIKTIVVNGQIEVAEDATLNLNGKTVSGTHADKYSMIHVQNGATLTIKGEGKITYAAGGNNTGAAIWVEGGLVQDGGDISATGTWSFGFAVDLRPNAWGTAHTEPASFVMNAGSLSSTDTAIRVASNSSDAYEEMGVSFTMNGGKITSDWDAIFVQHLYEGDLDVLVKDGEISGANSTLRIYADVAGSDVDMDIQGGTFTGVMKVADAYATADPIVITGGTFDTDVSAYVADGYEAVANEDGTFHVGEIPPVPAAMIGSAEYATFAEALDKVQDGEVITLTDGVTGDESGTEINFEKDITFTITGNAPDYALPIITFQNATVNIEDAEILIPELDARQNATINVINSTVHDAGGNSIVKSYYNGAINISGTSMVHAMQVTTMGYITVSDSAKLNATWQTNVYGNGLITLEDDATFATAALHLTAKEYSGRDNTDADRVGKPATIVVDGANFTVGKVYSDSGADYSYNSSKGINIGTLEGKSALLDIKNGANVTIFMANGEKAIVGKDGSVKLDSSSFQVACRGAEGTVTLEIADETFDVYGESTLNIPTLSGELYLQNGATVKDSTVGGSANIYGEVTFSGDNTFAMLSDFGAYYCGEPGAHWTVAEGGSLTLTQLGSNRYGLGYGDKVTVYGEIEDALTARDGLTDADADLNIYNGLVGMTNSGFKDTVNSFAAENAYVIFGVEGDKSFGNKFGNYWANYTYDFDNCVITANAFKFYEANSVSDLNVAKSDLYVNGIFMTDDADSEFTFTDSVIYSRATSNGTDDKNQNAGELTLVRSSLTYNAPFTNNGTLNLGEGSSLSAPSISGNGKIVIDGAKLTAESTPIVGNASDFTGTIEVINNDGLVAQIDKDGNVVLVALVAEVGGETFTSLADAIAAAGADDVITLLNNVTLPEAISIANDKTVSIDLAGYTVSYTSNVPGEDMISNHGTLIIDDSSENGTGKITYLNTDTTGSNVTVSTITNDFGGVLTVEGGTIENTSSAAKAWTGEIFPFAIDNVTNSDLGPAVTTINGGKIVSNYRSIRLFANGATEANTVEINGGTMVGQVWLQSPNKIQNKASLTITGGSFQPAGNDGSSVYITTASSKEVDVAVSGGTFNTKIGIDNTANVSGVITGGTFTAAAKNGTNEALLARGFQFVESENGSFSPEFVPSGTFMGGFVNMADPEEVFISTEIRDLNAAESVVLKIYDENDTLLATTTLLKAEYFVSDVLSVKTIITGDSSSWNTEWEDTMPRSDYVPAYGVLIVDGTEVSRANIKMESAEDVPCDWAEVPGVTPVCDIVGHVDEDKDHACDVCQETTDCVDADPKDHKCDVCGEELSECVDEDKDHACDICGENVGKHEAAEGSHDCDYCGKPASECADEDKDHKCDVCGEVLSECKDENSDYKCDICGKDLPKPDPTEPDETEPDETEPDETEPSEPAKSIIRLAGKDRFETSLMAADMMKKNLGVDKFNVVILASGANFADALTGSYLATVKNAPILLTYKAEQNAAVVNYVKANLKAGGTVYILGGTGAVDSSLDSMLAEFDVNRLAGKDRFDTNLMILKEAGIKSGDEILVCTSTDFADALSASAVGKPILLVHNEKSKLYDNQKELLASLSGNKFCIIGGENVVSTDMEGLIKEHGTTERLAGANRLVTSVMVAERYFSNAKDAIVAYGWNYPDGLCGGPLAFAMGAPLILGYDGYADVSAAFVAAKGISSGVVLGGESLVSDATVGGIFAE